MPLRGFPDRLPRVSHDGQFYLGSTPPIGTSTIYAIDPLRRLDVSNCERLIGIREKGGLIFGEVERSGGTGAENRPMAVRF